MVSMSSAGSSCGSAIFSTSRKVLRQFAFSVGKACAKLNDPGVKGNSEYFCKYYFFLFGHGEDGDNFPIGRTLDSLPNLLFPLSVEKVDVFSGDKSSLMDDFFSRNF